MHKVSLKAANLIGSEIIKLGAEINQKIKDGHEIYNLTIGDFNPKIFPIPEVLKNNIVDAYLNNQTNYPPADGMPELRTAVKKFISTYEGVSFNDDEIIIAGGGRPLIHSIYKSVLDPGDKVLYPVPSWNNNHYCHLSDAQKVEVPTRVEDGFMPTAEMLAPHLGEVVLLALCSPLNPTGTTFKKEELEKICDLVLAENRRREGKQKPLYLLFDQIYWMLTASGTEHINPIGIRPEMKPYTLFVDGISKAFAATGVRVGWGLGPAEVVNKMKSIIGHIGAWAPRAEQIATAKFLENEDALKAYMFDLKNKLDQRFNQLYQGIEALRLQGFPVQIIKPEGAIYLSVRFQLAGKKMANGQPIETTQDITNFLIQEGHVALVPFTAFGCQPGTDWFRISVGTLQLEEIPNLLDNLKRALNKLT